MGVGATDLKPTDRGSPRVAAEPPGGGHRRGRKEEGLARWRGHQRPPDSGGWPLWRRRHVAAWSADGCGDTGLHEPPHGRAKPDRVPGGDRANALSALLVHERAVARPEVLDRRARREHAHDGMPARYLRVGQEDVAALAADRRPRRDRVPPTWYWRLLDEDVRQGYRPPGPTPAAMRTIWAYAVAVGGRLSCSFSSARTMAQPTSAGRALRFLRRSGGAPRQWGP